MPCDLQSNSGEHNHNWPTSGELTIERCERFCAFCTGDGAEHVWKFAWFLRRHVQTVHLDSNEYPNLTLCKGWSRAPDGNVSGRRATRRRTPTSTKKTQKRELAAASTGDPAGNTAAVSEPIVQMPLPPPSAFHFFSPTAPAMAGFNVGVTTDEQNQATHGMMPGLFYPNLTTGTFNMAAVYPGMSFTSATAALPTVPLVQLQQSSGVTNHRRKDSGFSDSTATSSRSIGKARGLTLNTNLANGLSSDASDGTPKKISPLGSSFSTFLVDSLRNTPVATTPVAADVSVTHGTPESVPSLTHTDDETMTDDSEEELDFGPMGAGTHFMLNGLFGTEDMQAITKPDTPLSANVMSLIKSINDAVAVAATSGRVTNKAKQVKALQSVLNEVSTAGNWVEIEQEEILARL